MKYINFLLKLRGSKSFSENQNTKIKRNKPKAKSSKFKKISIMNKEKLKTNIKKEKFKLAFTQQNPPKKSNVKKNKHHVKNTYSTKKIINNNIVLNFKVNAKDSSYDTFSHKNKKMSKSKIIKIFSKRIQKKSLCFFIIQKFLLYNI